MKNRINRVKMFAIVLFALPLVAVLLLNSSTLPTRAADEPQDAAAMFKDKEKFKCSICHGEKAEKKFDATKPDDALVKIVLEGFKPEKPPNMPAYGAKGVTEDQAKALVAYMKSLRQ